MENIEFSKTLGVIDLISEKHKLLRQATMDAISANVDDKLSQMDVYLLSLVHYQPMSVSESARYMNISRQAAHKHVKHLLESGFIELGSSDSNRRDKIVNLTASGIALSQQINAVKQQMEAQVEALLGTKDYQHIKALFSTDWQLT
ncbi:MarR family transcriptional regulator [Shewanella sp. UCD-KL21]|uniref:MarR family transcriptional regulator n=1 Tax=Shewanella sp. UCD-KL21 TaxID=1917164 RepID=UPI0009713B1B|nr:MarR family transcriptional regulator [Shewanella sp. UCD-KL21]